jgi:hypothetical protein
MISSADRKGSNRPGNDLPSGRAHAAGKPPGQDDGRAGAQPRAPPPRHRHRPRVRYRLYFTNFYGFTALFPWFAPLRTFDTLVVHALFGVAIAKGYWFFRHR